MEENQKFKCSGDCLNCRKNPNERMTQWQYCASQFTYNSMRMLEDMRETFREMQGTIDELKAKIEAIQNNEATVFDPTKEENPLINISQIGDGE